MAMKGNHWNKSVLPRQAAPCKDCQDRELGCHGKCARYQEYWNVQEKKRRMRVLNIRADYWPKGK